jgi:hypothetical protein
MFCSVKGVQLVDLDFPPLKRLPFKRMDKGWCALSQLENGDELPSCFLGRSRLGRPLPCAIRLRTQRSNHVAIK